MNELGPSLAELTRDRSGDLARNTSLGVALSTARPWWHGGLVIAWGMLLSLWLARAFFIMPPGQMHKTDEFYHYPPRVVEFLDLLRAGYWSPQWCSDFDNGIGSPYFSYYQPGFFYLTSLVSWFLPPLTALGVVVFAACWTGYLGLAALLRKACSLEAGALGGTCLLMSVYTGSEITLRGDYTELTAMMLFPWGLLFLWRCLEAARLRDMAGLAAVGCMLVITHPCVALIAYPALLTGAVAWGKWRRQWLTPLAAWGALVCGAGAAAFYWLPVFGERSFVKSNTAFEGFLHYSEHFVGLLDLLAPWAPERALHWGPSHEFEMKMSPVTLGWLLPLLAAVQWWLFYRTQRTAAPERKALAWFALAGFWGAVVMMHRVSEPIWNALPLLYQLQFPWRFLALATVFLALLCGLLPDLMARREWRWAPALGCLLVAAFGLRYTPITVDESRPRFFSTDPLVLRGELIVPDLKLEWSSPAFDVLKAVEYPTVTADDQVFAGELLISQGRFRIPVRSQTGGQIVLRLMYFPLGWRTSLNGAPAPMLQNDVGLMRFEIPPGTEGVLEGEFSMTPMRRRGWWISAGSLAAGLLAAAAVAVLRRRRAVRPANG